GGTGASMDVESIGSCPAMTSCRRAASSTVRAHGPPWSSELEKATMPYRETAPYVGFTPTVPVTEAGCRMEPPVSVPMASGAMCAASAAEEPPPEPPGILVRSQGLPVGPYALFSVDDPMANSSMFVLPRMTTSAALRRLVSVASYGG